MKTLLGAGALVLSATLSATLPATAAPSSPAGAAALRTVLDVSDLEQGAPPAIAWSESAHRLTRIHAPGGATTPAPDGLTAFAPMGSGYVVQSGTGRTTTRWIAADGSFGRHTWTTGAGLAVSPGGHVVAFAGSRGRVWTVDQEGDRVFRFPRVHFSGTGHAVSVAGENCKEGEDPASIGGCSIVVNGAHRAEYTTSHGIVDRVPRLRQVTTGRGRWLGGTTAVSDTGSCSAMMKDFRVRWRTCDNQLSDISTDSRHLLGTPAYADGFGPQVLDVLATADGSVVRTFAARRDGSSATYVDQVWEDATHVLVVTFQDGEWAVVRLGVDGSMEYAVAPRAGSSGTRSPFRLQSR